MGIGYSYIEYSDLYKNHYFIDERLLDSDITIGISDTYHQCIRINGSQLYELTRMIKTSNPNRIILEFEEEIKLSFLFSNKNKIFYQLDYPELGIEIENRIFSNTSFILKPFRYKSDEFDYLINNLK